MSQLPPIKAPIVCTETSWASRNKLGSALIQINQETCLSRPYLINLFLPLTRK